MEIPVDTVGIVVTFIPDPVTLCRLACACQDYTHLVREDHASWERLARRRWTRGNWPFVPDDAEDVEEEQPTWRDEYRRRHELDVEAVALVNDMGEELLGAVKSEGTLGGGIINMTKVPQAPDNWRRVVSLGLDVFDACRGLYFRHEASAKGISEATCKAFMAGKMVHGLSLVSSLETLLNVAARQEYFVPGGPPEVERCAVAVAKTQLGVADLLTKDEGPMDDYVTQQMDRMAATFQERMEAAGVTNNDVEAALTILNELLFVDLGFQGNVEDYYNVQNSMINHVLRTKKGIPLTLCIIYAGLCERVGLRMDFVGLPGHVVLEAHHEDSDSDSRLFVDVFEGGTFLTVADCINIVRRLGFRFIHHGLPLMSSIEVAMRLLNNLSYAYRRAGFARGFGGAVNPSVLIGTIETEEWYTGMTQDVDLATFAFVREPLMKLGLRLETGLKLQGTS